MDLKVLNVYAKGEGYITFLLLKSLAADGLLKACVRAVDKLIFTLADLNLLIVPDIDDSERIVLENHPHKERLVIISKNCGGLENCVEPAAKGPFFYSALLEVAKVLNDYGLEKLVRSTSLETPIDAEKIKPLAEKVSFYFPVLIGKRDSVLYGWKYFLGKVKIPSVTHGFPRDSEILPKVFSNYLFTDKMVPIFLGMFPAEVIERIKEKGFVPYQVKIEGENNLDSELKLIEYGRKVAQAVRETL